MHPLSWVPPFTHYTLPSPAGAAGAPGLHVALQLPTACWVPRWCKIPLKVPQAHQGVGPHTCSRAHPPAPRRKAATLQGNSWQWHTRPWLLLFPLQGLPSCYNLLCFFSTFPADPFFVSVSLKLLGYPLILLVAIFHFKWPAWGKHAPDR